MNQPVLNYKNIFLYPVIVCLLFSCSPKLGQEFYNSKEEIIFQHHASFMPNGYNLGLTSQNYPGVLAIVRNDLIFDAMGAGSRPWMKKIKPFRISRNKVETVEISDEKALKRKIIIIKTETSDYCFYMADADEIYLSILDWLDQ